MNDQEAPIVERPEWLWNWDYAMYNPQRKEIIAYIEHLEAELSELRELHDGTLHEWADEREHLEAVNKNLRESAEILKALDAQKNQIIIDLGGEVP